MIIVTEQIYNDRNMKLKGIFTKELIEKFNIPIEQTKKHGIVKLHRATYELFEVPPPYDESVVFYGRFEFQNELVPGHYFKETELEEYKLTPIGEHEVPNVICFWYLTRDGEKKLTFESIIHYIYDRKNEEKYRLRLLTNPSFNPRDWEMKRTFG